MLSALFSHATAGTITLQPGMVITSSVRIAKKTYVFPGSASPDSAVITIRGSNITVDFNGATLQGTDPNTDPDVASGIAVRIDGGSHIRILHAHIRGYMIGILARKTQDIELIDNDISYNWKPRLFSLIEHESLLDWLTFHHNEQDEWLRYGGGIVLIDVSRGTISGTTAVQQMNGLMMTRCDHLHIENNNFSFNSGLGIGLYRSSFNIIVHNRIDYDVRGYSHRFFHRGQDSAGLLMYEQSSNNIVAYNSVTHGGDGLFIWAGQTTMDSGKGGVNDNIVYKNDFSFAPANGIEATFSRNAFLSNLAEGCDYGVWAGYSYSSKFLGNTFRNNRFGVAIEHGQDNQISSNQFDGDTVGISLWANPLEPSDWGYPKHHDTKSRNYIIEDNSFSHHRIGIKALSTDSITLTRNHFFSVDTMTVLKDTSRFHAMNNTSVSAPPRQQVSFELPSEYSWVGSSVISASDKIPESAISKMPRSAIIVDEWGPYDWQSPKLYPLDSSHTVPLRLRILGPPGKWKAVSLRGIEHLSKKSGKTGDTLQVTPRPDSTGDWKITLEYRGKQTTSPTGIVRKAGQPYRFSYTYFEPSVDWNVRFFSWNENSDPRSKLDNFTSLLNSTPILSQHPARLDYEWYRPPFPELPQERFAFEAEGTVNLSQDTYTLRTISDDAARVWIDGQLVIDNWMPHSSFLNYAALFGGVHKLRVLYYQVDGWAEFRLDILRGSNRSTGSP